MRASSMIQDYIKSFESLKLQAYLCPAGVWTIGWGHTKDVDPDDEITEMEAQALFVEDVEEVESYIDSLVTVSLTDPQFDALVSFIFNIGPTKFASSTLRAKLNAKDYMGAALEFKRWCKAWVPLAPGDDPDDFTVRDGKKLIVLRGLERRRIKEKQIFQNDPNPLKVKVLRGIDYAPKKLNSLEESHRLLIDMIEPKGLDIIE